VRAGGVRRTEREQRNHARSADRAARRRKIVRTRRRNSRALAGQIAPNFGCFAKDMAVTTAEESPFGTGMQAQGRARKSRSSSSTPGFRADLTLVRDSQLRCPPTHAISQTPPPPHHQKNRNKIVGERRIRHWGHQLLDTSADRVVVTLRAWRRASNLEASRPAARCAPWI